MCVCLYVCLCPCVRMSVYMYVCMYVTANQFYLYAHFFYLNVCVYVCMSACVRACRSICMSLVNLHVSCLSLSWCMFSHTDVCKSVFLFTFVGKYVSTYSMSRMYIRIHVRKNVCMCAYNLSFVRTSICMSPICVYAQLYGYTFVRTCIRAYKRDIRH